MIRMGFTANHRSHLPMGHSFGLGQDYIIKADAAFLCFRFVLLSTVTGNVV